MPYNIIKTIRGRAMLVNKHNILQLGISGNLNQFKKEGKICDITYTSHLGGSVQGADQANGHEAAESGHDELVTTLAEVDGDMGGSLYYFMDS